MSPPTADRLGRRHDRVLGALIGLAVGDALGVTVEHMDPAAIRAAHGLHREIVGGGVALWPAGATTDETAFVINVARVYCADFSIDAVVAAHRAWESAGPRDPGRTTGSAGLLRAIAAGLVQHDPDERAGDAAALSRVSHPQPGDVDAAIAIADLTAHLVGGVGADTAVELVLQDSPIRKRVRDLVGRHAASRSGPPAHVGLGRRHAPGGVWAVLQDTGFEDVLVTIVNRGGDADACAAVAGCLMGARDGAGTVPPRWRDELTAPTVDEASRRWPTPCRDDAGAPR